MLRVSTDVFILKNQVTSFVIAPFKVQIVAVNLRALLVFNKFATNTTIPVNTRLAKNLLSTRSIRHSVFVL